jgi:putative ABC transport system permease protein
LRKKVTPAELESPLKKIIASNAPAEYKNSLTGELKPLADYYLQWGNGKAIKMVQTVSALALFILLLVIVNFVIIMTSSSSRRLREIGLRKLFGGIRQQLIVQFLTESILMSILAMFVAFAFYIILRPQFQDLLGRALPGIHEIDLFVFTSIVVLVMLTGCLAGIYPAFRLSGFKIVQAVKGKLPAFGEGKFTRRFLLGFQVAIASFVLIVSVIISQQLKFIQNYDLGYTKRNVLVITSLPREWDEKGVLKLEAVRSDLMRDPGVSSVSISYEVPDGNAGNRYNFKTVENKEVDMPLLEVDEFFGQTFGIELVAGKFFHHQDGSYLSHRVVLNEEAVRSFGWTPHSAIGRQVVHDQDEKPFTVVGVIRNFNFNSLFESITPLSLVHIRDGSSYRYLSLSLSNADQQNTIGRLAKKWSAIFPTAPFDYIFMEDKINQFYLTENRIYKSSKVASVLAIVITLSGIVAFMSVSLVRRVQEIGIRRVHGATSVNLIFLLVKDFIWQFIVGGISAFVLAYFFLRTWLNNFHYKIDIPFATFFIVHMVMLLIMALLITVYSLRTVQMNPVKALRYE